VAPIDDVADVLIIGAGASGGVAALRLAQEKLRVVCLEQGGWVDPASYPGATPEAELAAGGPWVSDPMIRKLPADYPIDCSASDYRVSNFNAVGGGTILFNGQWPRMLPNDFRVADVDGLAANWPISYADLQPYYERADRQFGVSGLGGNPAYPPSQDPPLPPLPIGRIASRVAAAHAALGWHWWPGTNAILSAASNGRRPCVQRGTCGTGCNEGAKGSADVTHWSAATAAGVQLITAATVVRIEVDRRGRARGALWIDAAGRHHFQAANVVVVAANGVGTPRLLLASASPAHPDGLANSSGQVGRNLMLHPLVSVAAQFDGPADGMRAHSGVLIHSLQFADSDHSRGFARGATWAMSTSGGPLRHAMTGGVWGADHHNEVARRLGRTGSWVMICEDLPNETNRVVLGSTNDRFGLATPTLHYRRDGNIQRLMDWHVQRATESLLAARGIRPEVTHHPSNGHMLGTARMGLDPSSSVVDSWCVAHDVDNLLVIDGSVFVTAGSANPTSTIAAIALRATEQLIARAHQMRVPEQRSSPVTVPIDLDLAAWIDPRLTMATEVETPTKVAADATADSLTDAERTVLAKIADELIPRSTAMPSASDVGAHQQLIDRVIAVRPDLLERVRDGLALIDDEPDKARRVLAYAVAGAYYLAPEVRAALNLDVPLQAVRVDSFPTYIADGLLDHLIG